MKQGFNPFVTQILRNDLIHTTLMGWERLGSFKHKSKESNVQSDVTLFPFQSLQHPPQFLSLLPTAVAVQTEEWYQMLTLVIQIGKILGYYSWTHPKWIYANLSRNTTYVSHTLAEHVYTCPVAGLPAKLGALGIATFWGVGALAFQSITCSNAVMNWFILSKSKIIAKRTSLGGGAYKTSFALGVAAGPSSTASRNAPLSSKSRVSCSRFHGMYYTRDFPRLFL